jgi:hypothetical protein
MNDDPRSGIPVAWLDELIAITEETGADVLLLGRAPLGEAAISQLVTGKYTVAEYQDIVRKLLIFNPALRRKGTLPLQAVEAPVYAIALPPSSLEM